MPDTEFKEDESDHENIGILRNESRRIRGTMNNFDSSAFMTYRLWTRHLEDLMQTLVLALYALSWVAAIFLATDSLRMAINANMTVDIN